MKQTIADKIQRESIALLLGNSLRAIPFNVLVALLLTIDFFHNNFSPFAIISWFLCVVIVSYTRWLFSKYCQRRLPDINPRSLLIRFSLLTLVMGIVWGSCYLVFLPQLTELQEFIVILVLGGLCAGSVASFSAYLPAYYCYITPILLPVIIYNYYLVNFDRAIMASTFLLFVLMLVMVAKTSEKLLYKTLQLSAQKDTLINKLEVISVTDSLTGLYNRRRFKVSFKQEISRAIRNKYSLSLVALDIDNFKMINDNLGHPMGDQILIYTAKLLKKNLQRSNDIVFRLGGDEFAAILANISAKEIMSLCKTIQHKFKQFNRPGHMEPGVDHSRFESPLFAHISLSMGIAHIPVGSVLDINAAVLTADKALYQAKKQGKNKIVLNEVNRP